MDIESLNALCGKRILASLSGEGLKLACNIESTVNSACCQHIKKRDILREKGMLWRWVIEIPDSVTSCLSKMFVEVRIFTY